LHVRFLEGKAAVTPLTYSIQGSITHITNSSGSVIQELSYDAWGRLRTSNYLQAFNPGSEPVLLFGRGYTGHEHLTQFGLINMNARLYDPALGRFLSPDPYVQAPDFSQAFNRYSYCLNNPLKYTDESGEIFGILFGFVRDLFVNTVVKVWNQGFNAWSNSDNWQTTKMGWKIDKGLLMTDPNNNFWERSWQFVSRFTWELPQTLVGYGYTTGRNLVGNVSRVDYFGGATFATNEHANKNNGVSLGNFVNTNITDEITGDFNDYVITHPMYMHEYGHYIDSRYWGEAYLLCIGIPSGFSAAFSSPVPGQSYSKHDIFYTELRANKRARKYFEKNYGINWNFPDYPLNK
jgi:RHS repeat-associated protein